MKEDASSAGKLLSAQRMQHVRTCAVCGKEIIGISTRRYCSGACRFRAHYRRHRDEINLRKKAARERQREQRPIRGSSGPTGPRLGEESTDS
jgi:hypothetical protein